MTIISITINTISKAETHREQKVLIGANAMFHVQTAARLPVCLQIMLLNYSLHLEITPY